MSTLRVRRDHPRDRSLRTGESERSPWTMVANLLLNLDEVITKA